MRLWIKLTLAAAALAYFPLDGLSSSLALADIGARPVTALVSGDGKTRFPLRSPGQPLQPGEAQPKGGVGVPLGYQMSYLLPTAEVVVCTSRFRTLRCSGGWRAERPAPPG